MMKRTPASWMERFAPVKYWSAVLSLGGGTGAARALSEHGRGAGAAAGFRRSLGARAWDWWAS